MEVIQLSERGRREALYFSNIASFSESFIWLCVMRLPVRKKLFVVSVQYATCQPFRISMSNMFWVCEWIMNVPCEESVLLLDLCRFHKLVRTAFSHIYSTYSRYKLQFIGSLEYKWASFLTCIFWMWVTVIVKFICNWNSELQTICHFLSLWHLASYLLTVSQPAEPMFAANQILLPCSWEACSTALLQWWDQEVTWSALSQTFFFFLAHQ